MSGCQRRQPPQIPLMAARPTTEPMEPGPFHELQPEPLTGYGGPTAAEVRVIDLLGMAWNAYCELPREHREASIEFRRAIHRCQDLVGARAAWRVLNVARSTVVPVAEPLRFIPGCPVCKGHGCISCSIVARLGNV